MTTHLNPDHSVFDAEGVKVFYNGFLSLVDVHIKIPARKIIAFIGPSGCGKSTLLRCFNRMNDLIPGAKVEGKLLYRNQNIYDPQDGFPTSEPFSQEHLREYRLRTPNQRLSGKS